MELFHASGRRYAPGHCLIERVRDDLSEGHRDAEQRIARFAPPDARSRLTARLAADSAEFAAFYWDSEAKPGDEKHLYRVQAVPVTRHPMALVDVVARASDEAFAAVVAKEYWSPTHEWRFWEYLCTELVILEELPWPGVIELSFVKFPYGEDRKEALRLRP